MTAAAKTDPYARDIAALFFAYRRMTSVVDSILAQYGMGRAHHRVLFFVSQQPNVTLYGLRKILQIKNQSLARVMNDLRAAGFIEQTIGTDRRHRHLALTAAGEKLQLKCRHAQQAVLVDAIGFAGADAGEGFSAMLLGMMSEADRAEFQAMYPGV